MQEEASAVFLSLFTAPSPKSLWVGSDFFFFNLFLQETGIIHDSLLPFSVFLASPSQPPQPVQLFISSCVFWHLVILCQPPLLHQEHNFLFYLVLGAGPQLVDSLKESKFSFSFTCMASV